jgi:beta-N-acetylhexosaminidase
VASRTHRRVAPIGRSGGPLAKAAFGAALLLFVVMSPPTTQPGPEAVRRALAGGTGLPQLLPGDVPQPTTTAACAREPLTVPERAGQLVMAGIPDATPTAANAAVARMVGAIVLQGHNVEDDEQVATLTASLHRAGSHRLLVAIDEEGGRVSRLGEEEIVVSLPSARVLASSRSVREVRELARRLGARMVELGLDWNLAPVLDVTAADATTVIGDRSYGGDPDLVAAYGRAFAEGLAAAGVLTTGKHFPGHGATDVDSHETLPVVGAPLGALEAHLLPYREALPVLDTVMTAHVLFTALDDDRPASLSTAATRLLRQDIGFRGVLITDALEMEALTEMWSIPQAAELAVRAGADMVLVGPFDEVEATIKRLAQAARAGRLPEERLDQAVRRVLALKGYPPPAIDCLLA